MNMTPEHKAKLLAGKKTIGATPFRLPGSMKISLDFKEKIEEHVRRVSGWHPSFAGLLRKAFTGKSLASAARAKCADCSSYQRKEIASCKVISCPLWFYRPFQEEA